MPKYIDKKQLPQFKHYNFCEGKEYGWDFGNGQDSGAYYKSVETNDFVGPVLNSIEYKEGEIDFEEANDDFKKLLDSDNDSVFQELYDKWIENFKEKSDEWKLTQFVVNLLRAVHTDKHTALLWEERLKDKIKNMKPEKSQFMKFLAMLDGYLTFALLLRTAQGFPLKYRDGDIAYPKMLLIEDELYNSVKERKNWLDFNLLKRSVQDCCYVITVNGESAEKKMIFLIIDSGDQIQVQMLDRRNGISRFFVSRMEFDPDAANTEKDDDFLLKEYKKDVERFAEDHGAVIAADLWNCHPRGDYGCNGKEGSNVCYYCNGNHNCKHKSLSIIAAILYCFQEYQRKHLSEQKTARGNNSTKKPGEPAEVFVPEGMMRLYDIKMSEDEFRRTDKFALFNKSKQSEYPSTEKSPHVRRGTMRYNPKTGQKDIKVKGSIIHKDKYQGFASAERVKQ